MTGTLYRYISNIPNSAGVYFDNLQIVKRISTSLRMRNYVWIVQTTPSEPVQMLFLYMTVSVNKGSLVFQGRELHVKVCIIMLKTLSLC